MRSFAQPALVDKDDGAPLAERFFKSAVKPLASNPEWLLRRAPAPVRWDAGSSSRVGVYRGSPQMRGRDHLQFRVPYWVALDKHTPQGKEALRRLGAALGVSYRQLMLS